MSEEENKEECVACGSGFDSSEELQQALEENSSSDNEEDHTTIDLKVYDVPVELKNKYISLAKLEYDNQLWRVLDAGMDKLLEERQDKVPELENEVEKLQKQIIVLKQEIEEIKQVEDDPEPEGPVTFGSQKEKEVDEPEHVEGEEILERFEG
jgi:hypothetical protein